MSVNMDFETLLSDSGFAFVSCVIGKNEQKI